MEKFLDIANITVQAGNGGNGIVAFHREKFVDKGGPSGGDGGKGGSIYFIGDHNKNTLYELNFKKNLKGKKGENGSNKNMHGKNAEDLVVPVPLGTIIKFDNSVIGEITKNNQKFLVAKGGDGGRGNARFKSSKNKVPYLSENGSEGEFKELNLELKLLSDVALVGFPNVGKSTIISKITNAKPKIENYNFTTLIPNIGVSSYNNESFVVSDIPGLIEGASNGKGLGIGFLKHIERTRVICHVIDSTFSLTQIEKNKKIIDSELSNFSNRLSKLEQIIVFSKIDLIDQKKLKQLESKYKNAIFISSFKNANLDKLKSRMLFEIKNYKEIIEEKSNETFKYYKYESKKSKDFIIEKRDDGYYVKGQFIEYWSSRIPIHTDQNYQRFRMKLIKNNIFKHLETEGWKNDETIYLFIEGYWYEFI